MVVEVLVMVSTLARNYLKKRKNPKKGGVTIVLSHPVVVVRCYDSGGGHVWTC
jgi:hypothetical protein